MSETGREFTSAISLALIVLGVFGMLGVLGYTGPAVSHDGFDYKCLVEGPFRTSPPFALMSEAVEVRGHFSVWPLGRACDWERSDGLGYVTATSDWTATVAFLLCAVLAVSGSVLRNVAARYSPGAGCCRLSTERGDETA